MTVHAGDIQIGIDRAVGDGRGYIAFTNLNVDLDKSVVLPINKPVGGDSELVLDFTGSTINVRTGIVGFKRVIDDLRATQLRWYVPHFKGGVYRAEDKNTTCFLIHKTLNARFENMRIINFGVGIKHVMGLYADHQNVMCHGCRDSYVLSSGDQELWLNATNTNSASNMANFHNCRAQVYQEHSRGWVIQNSGHIKLDHCGFEGSVGEHAVWIRNVDGGDWAPFKDVYLDDCWFEITDKLKSLIKAQAKDSLIQVRNPQFGSDLGGAYVFDLDVCKDCDATIERSKTLNKRIKRNQVFTDGSSKNGNHITIRTGSYA